jgi:subtilisin family serine protease
MISSDGILQNDDNNPFDDHGHGTHVSGTIAAIGNNGVGTTGIMWDAKIMTLKFITAGGFGITFDAIELIFYPCKRRKEL